MKSELAMPAWTEQPEAPKKPGKAQGEKPFLERPKEYIHVEGTCGMYQAAEPIPKNSKVCYVSPHWLIVCRTGMTPIGHVDRAWRKLEMVNFYMRMDIEV